MMPSPELQAMLDKARRYMASAELLRQDGDFDSAVSRLYYAMFYSAEAALIAKGLTFSSHSAVIAAFAVQFVRPGLLPKHLHQWLYEAFGQRQIGDYMFDAAIGDADVRELQRRAGQFVAHIEALLHPPTDTPTQTSS